MIVELSDKVTLDIAARKDERYFLACEVELKKQVSLFLLLSASSCTHSSIFIKLFSEVKVKFHLNLFLFLRIVQIVHSLIKATFLTAD
jgi:hypothetical protein